MAKLEPPRHQREFEIAIICALQIEHDAVETLLDEDYGHHGVLYRKAAGDPNIYTTGRLGRHHVVIAYMPGIGKANAAVTAAGIRSSFQGVRLALIVGVCGAVPKPVAKGIDILLGDVLVSTAVLQVDFIRRYPNKSIIKDVREGNLGPPSSEIRSFIKKVSGHLTFPKVAKGTALHLRDLLEEEGFQDYQYPGMKEDRLYRSDHRHKHQESFWCPICEACLEHEHEICAAALAAPCGEVGCGEKGLIKRFRSSTAGKPVIHFGLFASGDAVMKSAQHRDEIVRQTEVIGFEMEAAGTWQIIPTIVVKAACDYADSHKNKNWQGYAALASAACAKALLEEWSASEKPSNELISHEPNTGDLRLDCMRSLSFAAIDARENNIRSAHRDTCGWLFKTSQFEEWRTRANLETHNGVLWMKGKPGAGKSTLMKHALSWCRRRYSKHVFARFFFNARGETLEKTPLGMFRSLAHQLIDLIPILWERILPHFLEKRKKYADNNVPWYAEELREFLLAAVAHPRFQPTFIFIDALDECSELEVRQLVSFIEELSVAAAQSRTTLYIFLSSRHYPTISMKKNIELTVESPEHDKDIAIYIKDKLLVKDVTIELALIRKAKGIFMWVVLVVEMLNKEHDEGRLSSAMNEHLERIPSGLNEVFRMLLEKDNAHKDETVLLLQWVLFAVRPLSLQELYHAVLVKDPYKLEGWHESSTMAAKATRFITTVSIGLVEIRYLKPGGGGERQMQFIHESVNDFLLRDKRLHILDPALEACAIGLSHYRLVGCCFSYLQAVFLYSGPLAGVKWHASTKKHPFLQYASVFFLNHLHQACRENISPQPRFHFLLQNTGFFETWKKVHDSLRAGKQPVQYGLGTQLLYILVLSGFPQLTESLLLEHSVDVNAHGGRYGFPLEAAARKDSKRDVELLLAAAANVNAQGGYYGTALQAAAFAGSKEIVLALLNAGANVNASGGRFGNALQAAAYQGRSDILKLLLDAGADVNNSAGHYGSPMQAAAASDKGDFEEMLRMLLAAGARINTQGGYFGNALQAAASSYKPSHIDDVGMLLDLGADVNATGGCYGTALQAAATLYSGQELIRKLLAAGADPNIRGGRYGNAINAAVRTGQPTNAQILRAAGAKTDEHTLYPRYCTMGLTNVL